MANLVRRSSNSGSVAATPVVNTFNNSPTAIGNVVKIPNNYSRQDFLRPFNVNLAGAASASTTFMLGDPSGMLALIIGGTFGTITSNSIGSGANGAAAFNAIVGYRPVLCDSFNYIVSSASQYSNIVKMVTGALDGSSQNYPININSARRSSDFQTTILTVETPVLFAPGFGFFITVGAGLTATLTFNPVAEWNPGM